MLCTVSEIMRLPCDIEFWPCDLVLQWRSLRALPSEIQGGAWCLVNLRVGHVAVGNVLEARDKE